MFDWLIVVIYLNQSNQESEDYVKLESAFYNILEILNDMHIHSFMFIYSILYENTHAIRSY